MLWPKPVHMAMWMTNLLDVNKLGQGKPDKVMAECHSVSSRKKKKKKIIYIYSCHHPHGSLSCSNIPAYRAQMDTCTP